MTVELNLEDITVSTDLKLSGDMSGEISVSDKKEIYHEQVGGTRDYEKLENLPKLDDEIIIGNVQEKDPTVPIWAKSSEKPVYSQEDIGIGAISLVDLDKLFKSL